MGEADEEAQVRVREPVAGTRAPPGHHPDHVAAGEQRGRHQPFLGVVLLAWDLYRTRIAGGVVHNFRYGPVRQVADDALAELDGVGHDELCEIPERNDRHERSGSFSRKTALVSASRSSRARSLMRLRTAS